MLNNNSKKYPKDWLIISRIVKLQAGWKCKKCGREHDPKKGYSLTVHHIDENPENCMPDNLIALCQRCHLSVKAYPWLLNKKQLMLFDI